MPAFMPRRAVLALTVMFGLLQAAIQPALAAGNVAESYVGDNIHKGLEILNNKGLPKTQREQQFEVFLLNLTDMKRIAMFTLGQYRRGASQADQDAFAAAFQNYATAVYQSYFSKYSGQTLKVTGSTTRSPTDFVVATELADPGSSQPPLEVDFRVRTDAGRPVVVDFSVSGIWLSLEERDQFVAFLGQNGGNIHTLITHLSDLAKQYRTG
jgi:phospholipid transport system substrate-binding protein